ncbi:hypothetical protein [Myroides phaeus]|nr:hypothetical protein [Myroides phaeus]MEC4117447.1 hypothetical protein [Myroides phaeus]
MKRFRMFGGPNGSGKSTLLTGIAEECSIGYYVNADEIEKELRANGFIDCSNFFPTEVSNEQWLLFLNNLIENDTRVQLNSLSSVRIKENVLIIEAPINSYIAAVIAEFMRYILLDCDVSFSFETVMSHPSKVEFLKEAKAKGFKTYLYFISTQDPSINISRVANRVGKGGHDVDTDKIVSRYYRSMELLCDAFLSVDRAYIIDSSMEDGISVFVEKNGDDVTITSEEVPEWIGKYLLEKLQK